MSSCQGVEVEAEATSSTAAAVAVGISDEADHSECQEKVHKLEDRIEELEAQLLDMSSEVPAVTATTDAMVRWMSLSVVSCSSYLPLPLCPSPILPDRKSTRLNSSHVRTSRMPSSA